MILLSEDIISRIWEEGEKSYPNECCGFLLGQVDAHDDRLVRELIVVSNAREQEAQRRRFSIEPQQFMDAERRALASGLDLLGIYHSHPDHPAIPSEYDLNHALPFYSYIIISVEKGCRTSSFTSWILEPDRSSFGPEVISRIILP